MLLLWLSLSYNPDQVVAPGPSAAFGRHHHPPVSVPTPALPKAPASGSVCGVWAEIDADGAVLATTVDPDDGPCAPEVHDALRDAVAAARFSPRKGQSNASSISKVWFDWPEGSTTAQVLPLGPRRLDARLMHVPDMVLPNRQAVVVRDQVCTVPLQIDAHGAHTWTRPKHCSRYLNELADQYVAEFVLSECRVQGLPAACERTLVLSVRERGRVEAVLLGGAGRALLSAAWRGTYADAPSVQPLSGSDPVLSVAPPGDVVCRVRALVDAQGSVEDVVHDQPEPDACADAAFGAAREAVLGWAYPDLGEPISQGLVFVWERGEGAARRLTGPPGPLRVKRQVKPDMPERSVASDGHCVLYLSVSPAGTTTVAESYCGAAYLGVAQDAAHKWEFYPDTLDGHRVPGVFALTLLFKGASP